jgi:hypothetical protein
MGEVTFPIDATPTAPELIAGKYKSEEDLDKGIMELVRKQHGDVTARTAFYKELESKLGQPAADPAATPVVDPVDTPSPAPDLKVPDAPEGIPQVDFEGYSKEFAEKGALSPETYAKIQKDHNFGKAEVDMWIEGQQAAAELHTNKVFTHVGGQEKYMELLNWANGNLTVAEKQEFNTGIEVRDPAKWTAALDALQAKYTRANGSAPNLISADGGAASTSAFGSQKEMVEAIKDPRYQSDTAYRTQVQRRIAAMAR